MGSALLISGVDSIGVCRLPKLLHDAGYAVHLLGSDRFAVAKSRYLAGAIPSAPGPEAAASKAKEHLSSHRERYQTILLGDEPSLWAALDLGNANSLETGAKTCLTSGTPETPPNWMSGWAPVPWSPRSIGLLCSKTAFLVASREAGISVPPFEIVGTTKELWQAVAKIGFPVYFKSARGWAGSGLRFATSRASLESQLVNLSFLDPCVVQREVEGVPGSISVLYNAGVPVCWFAYLMSRTWPNRFSSASRITFLPHPEAAGLTAAVGRLTQFSGLAGIDFVVDRESGHLRLLEFNPRPTPVYHLGHYAGVDFARALREMAAGASVPQEPDQSTLAVDLFPQGLHDSIENFRPLGFANALFDAPWDDPGVAAALGRRFVTHYIPEWIKKSLKRGI